MREIGQAFAYGVALRDDGVHTIAVRRGDRIVDLGEQIRSQPALPNGLSEVLGASDLMPLLAAGREIWSRADEAVISVLAADANPPELSCAVQMLLAFEVADFVDFYASRQHSENVGRIFRPAMPDLPPAWLSLPIGYHGRAGSVVVSSTPVRRPCGQIRVGGETRFEPTAKLDLEAEIGYVVGVPSPMGQPVSVDEFEDHVFGICAVNDWSARDIQSFEYVPLGPFLGKSFATTVSAWITPLSQLQAVRVSAPSETDTDLASYLRETRSWGLDLCLDVEINGEVVSRPPHAAMHWSPAQMLAHTTVNGAPLRTGDLFASGTVSGASPDQYGSLLELTHDATKPIHTASGPRGYLEDGDHVVIRAHARMADGTVVDLYEAAGTVIPATSHPEADVSRKHTRRN